MLSHKQKLLLQTHDGIVLCRGINAAGKHFWLYVKAARDAIERMHRDHEQQKSVDFLAYGEVIQKGMGEMVPQEVKQFMESEYQFEHQETA